MVDQRLRTQMMFEKEMELTVVRMSQIGLETWMIEASDGNTYTVRNYYGPLSED